MSRALKLLATLFSSLLLLGLMGLGGVWLVFDHYSQDLPDYTVLKTYEPPVTTRLYAGDGRLLAEYAAERRLFTPIADIPDTVRNAFLSAEDKDFYRHQGLDFMGIARAVLINLENLASDKRPVGASTITQQVAKNMLLTNEVSIARKVKEAILAQRIEKVMSKDRILELYLNQIFLGQRSYGVTAAAQNYFNKSLKELTIAEAAFLAVLPKAPSNYHPVRNREAALERRNWVLSRMAEDGRITKADAEEAMAEPIVMRSRADTETVAASYFAEEVRRELAERYGDQNVFQAGLAVRTSVEPELQAAATRALRNGLLAYDRKRGFRGPLTTLESMTGWHEQLQKLNLPSGGEEWTLAVVIALEKEQAVIGLLDGTRGEIPFSELSWAAKITRTPRGTVRAPAPTKPADALSIRDVIMVEPIGPAREKALRAYTLRQVPLVQGAMMAMNPHTGRVLAMVGGFSSAVSQFNRATQALRQPGSAFKPFVYLAALDNGFTPSSLVLDAPISLEQGPGLPKWEPENYSEQFYGPTPLRVGIEKSRNVMTVRLAHALGMPMIARYAQTFGITDSMPPYLSAALGAIETTPLKLTTAYAMLASGGKKITPSFIDRIQDKEGKTLWRNDNRECTGCVNVAWTPPMAVPALADPRETIADARTTYQIVSMLEGVVARGTATALRDLGKPIAGKTGTTNDSRDAWFLGFTPDLVASVFIGFDEPKTLGTKETGASLAVPVFKEFMETALKDQPGIPFRIPPGVRLVKVNPETGLLSAPGDKLSIWEAFLPGTEPVAGQTPAILDDQTLPQMGAMNFGPPDAAAPPLPADTSEPQAQEGAAGEEGSGTGGGAGSGTGGLY